MSHTIHIFGKLMNDPEVRFTPTGKAVTDLNISDSRKIKGQDGESVWENTYFKVTAWEQTAEFVGKHFVKGDYVSVSGTLAPTIRIWEGSDGNPRAGYELARTHHIERAWPNTAAPTDADEDDDKVPF